MELVLHPLANRDGEGEVEIVEHKGIGHPDTICDALAETFGAALGRHYLEHVGRVLHFNVDKALLVGGVARPCFGGGEVVEPIQIFLAGRATRDAGDVRVPIEEIARESCKAWVKRHMHALDPERHIVWNCLVKGGSSELVDLYSSSRGEWLANDTSVGAGFAPKSMLERTVLAAGDRLRSLARARAEVGEDVKVMGVRRGSRLHLTVACALIGAHIDYLDTYAERRDDIAREVAAAAGEAAGREVTVEVNTADDLPSGRVYLTVTGTSAEGGDDGEVGRGNRANGLITPYRPMSLEATAGKNPAAHVGKLYNVAADRISAALVERIPEIAEAQCFLLSRIGRRVDDPVLVDVRVRTHNGMPLESVRTNVARIVEEYVGSMGSLSKEILAGRVRLF